METRNINGEVMDLDQAVEKNKRLIWSTVQKYVRKGEKFGYEPNDLFSIASIGFIKAFQRFDPEAYPVRFSTYAVPMMIGEIQRYFRDNAGDVKFSRPVILLGNKIAREDMVDEPMDVIALHFDVTEHEVTEALQYLFHGRARSTEETIYNHDGDDVTLGDTLGNNRLGDYSKAYVSDFLDSLEPRDRTIIEMVMAEKTQREIGEEIGVTQVQVSRLLIQLHPHIEQFFGYPVGYFSKRKVVNVKKERIGKMPKKEGKRKVKGDLELAKELLKTTKKTPCSIAKETGCGDTAVYYWAKKIRTPQEEEAPVTVSRIELVEEDKKAQEVIQKTKEEIEKKFGVPSEALTGKLEVGYPEMKVEEIKQTEEKVKYQEELMAAEEAAKQAEEYRNKLLKQSKIGFGYTIAADEINPSDLHVLFTQAGHTAASSGVENLNVNIFISTEKINA